MIPDNQERCTSCPAYYYPDDDLARTCVDIDMLVDKDGNNPICETNLDDVEPH